MQTKMLISGGVADGMTEALDIPGPATGQVNEAIPKQIGTANGMADIGSLNGNAQRACDAVFGAEATLSRSSDADEALQNAQTCSGGLASSVCALKVSIAIRRVMVAQ